MRTVQAALLMDGPADLDLAVEELAALRKRIRELEARAEPLGLAVIAAMNLAGYASFTTSAGTSVRLSTKEPVMSLEIE